MNKNNSETILTNINPRRLVIWEKFYSCRFLGRNDKTPRNRCDSKNDFEN
jgi:hypothetical protein